MTDLPSSSLSRGPFYAFLLLNFGYCFAVILWGAVVRATGSGAGCGAHWPLCHGDIIITTLELSMLIEFLHRAMSGLLLITIIIATVASFRWFPPPSTVRLWAVVVLVFVLLEAAIGAGLVIFELTGTHISELRGYVMGAHLINTFFLVAAGWLHLHAVATGGLPPKALLTTIRTHRWLALSLIGFLLTAATGAMVALGDTIFPSSSLAEGFWQTHQPHAHLFVRLRTFHPLLALATSALGLLHTKNLCTAAPELASQEQLGRTGYVLAGLLITQLVMGVLNWLLLVPLWTQLIHLGLALMIWVVLIHSMILLASARGRNLQSSATRIHATLGGAG